MGFFTSRKEDNYTSAGGGKKEDKSMVQVLRSRFVSLVFVACGNYRFGLQWMTTFHIFLMMLFSFELNCLPDGAL
jgi:hypothetical protein